MKLGSCVMYLLKDAEVSAADEGGDVSLKYSGLSFVIPAGAEYSETDSLFSITFEEKKRLSNISVTDISDLSSDTFHTLSTLTINSELNAFDDFQNQQTGDIDIAGVTGVSTTAIVEISGTWYNYMAVAFVNEGYGCHYLISYVADMAESDSTDYEEFTEFLKSIKLL